MRKKNILKNALILTSAGLITKVLGFVYRIYMANTIGAEGMGIYQLIVPIYVLAWSISCSGFTTSISKLVAEEKGRNNPQNMRRILKLSTLMSVSVSIVVSIIIYFFAKTIAMEMYNDDRIIIPLKILSLGIPFMALGSCIRGYFFGIQKTTVPAISQVLEQLIRMVSIFALVAIQKPDNIELACIYAITAVIIAEICSCIFVLICFSAKNKEKFKRKSMPIPRAINLILIMALPLTANRVISSFLSTYENMLIPLKLQEFGFSKTEAITLFGKITGMALPLIYFPSALLTAVSISLVPAISSYMATNDKKNINYTISKSLLFTSIIGSWASIIFVVYSSELSNLIYTDDISLYLISFGFMCPILYIHIVMNGILNGLGHQLFIFRNSLLSSILVIGFIYFLMPSIGIWAYFTGLALATLITTLLDIYKIRKYIFNYLSYIKTLLMPILCAFATGLLSNYILNNLNKYFDSNIISLIFGGVFSSILFALLIIFSGCIKFSEIKIILNHLKSYVPIKKQF